MHHAQSTAPDDPARGSGPRCSVLCGRLRLLSVSPFLHSSQDPTIVVAIAELAESSRPHRTPTHGVSLQNVLRPRDVRSHASLRVLQG